MDAVVVDTDVISFVFKGDSRAAGYRPHLIGRLLVVSFMSVAELELWSLQKNWGQQRRDQLRRHLNRFVLHQADLALCEHWAWVRDTSRRNGRQIGIADGWIAATALAHQIPLVTHNPSDFTGVAGLSVISA